MVDSSPPPPGEPRGLSAWLLERALTGAPDAWSTRAARRWVLARPALREMYDDLRGAGRVLSGRAFSPEQAGLVLADLQPARGPARARGGAWGLAAAAAAAAVFFLVGDDGAHPRAATQGAMGVKVQCLTGAGEEWRVRGAAVAGVFDPVERLSCPRDALYTFALTNLSKAPVHVFVIGVDQDNQLHWFAPFGQDARSLPVGPGTVERLVDTVADAKGQVWGSDLTLFALFGDKPLSGSRIEQELRAAQGQLRLGRLSRLPLDVEHQARLELYASSGSSP